MSDIVVSVVSPDVSAKPGFRYTPMAWIGTVQSVHDAEAMIASMSNRGWLRTGMLVAAAEGDEWGPVVACGRVTRASSMGARMALTRGQSIVDQDGTEVPARALGVGGVAEMFHAAGLKRERYAAAYTQRPLEMWTSLRTATTMVEQAAAMGVRHRSLLGCAAWYARSAVERGITTAQENDARDLLDGLRLALSIADAAAVVASGAAVPFGRFAQMLVELRPTHNTLSTLVASGPPTKRSTYVVMLYGVVAAEAVAEATNVDANYATNCRDAVRIATGRMGIMSERGDGDTVRQYISAAEIVLSIACMRALRTP